jgi:predicted exporter
MTSADRKSRIAMSTIFIVLALASAIIFIIEGLGVAGLLLALFALLALFLAVTTPKQLQEFMDTLLD